MVETSARRRAQQRRGGGEEGTHVGDVLDDLQRRHQIERRAALDERFSRGCMESDVKAGLIGVGLGRANGFG